MVNASDIMLLVVLTLAIVFANREVSKPSAKSCSLSSSMPDSIRPQIVTASENNVTAVIRLAGYFHDQNQGFRALDINRAVPMFSPGSPLQGVLTLQDDCVGVQLAFEESGGVIRLESRLTSYEGRDFYLRYLKHSFPTDKRYSCFEREFFDFASKNRCQNYIKYGELIIESLELEIHLPEEPTSDKQFIKPKLQNSCSYKGRDEL